MKLGATQIAKAVNGRHYGVELMVHGVSTDTRKISAKSLFVALRGDNFDGHDFVAQASASGAVAALVEHAVDADIAQIIVPNTRVALAQLARYWREQMPATVIGITGSCGKTTVKEMLASILRVHCQNFSAVHATKGNLNNDLGVPLTLLDFTPSHQFGVIEMGANHLGEISYCAEIAQPGVSVITMVAPAHLEGFGTLDLVAQAKTEIYAALPVQGCAVINADDAYADYFVERAGARKILRFGQNANTDVRAINIAADVMGRAQFDLSIAGALTQVTLPLAGTHHISNALAAAACAHAVSVTLADIALGLAQTPQVKGRMNLLLGVRGEQLIDDTYNANTASMKAALDYLAVRPGKRIAVLGSMAELGDSAGALHRELGVYAASLKLDAVYSLSGLSAQISASAGGQHFDDLDALLAHLTPQLDATTTVLVKGSRSAAMERVIAALQGQALQNQALQTQPLQNDAATNNNNNNNNNSNNNNKKESASCC